MLDRLTSQLNIKYKKKLLLTGSRLTCVMLDPRTKLLPSRLRPQAMILSSGPTSHMLTSNSVNKCIVLNTYYLVSISFYIMKSQTTQMLSHSPMLAGSKNRCWTRFLCQTNTIWKRSKERILNNINRFRWSLIYFSMPR